MATAMALGLAACTTPDPTTNDSSQPASAASTTAEQVTLRLYWWGGDARHERTQQAIDAFMVKHPNITVQPEFSDWAGYWDKLATSTAGNNSPDVIQMDQLYLASYGARGTLTDLSTLPELNTSNLEPAVLGMGQWDGAQLAMPISTASFGLMVNLDILGNLGITLPDTTKWTWDEFATFAKSITDASGGSVAGTGIMNNEYSLQLFARQKGDQLFSDGDIVIKPETLAAYLQLGLDQSTSGAAPSASHIAETASLALDQGDFSTGKLAMSFTQATQISAYAKASGANIQLVQIPSFDSNKAKYEYFKPGMYWSVSSQSKHPHEAAILIDFLVNDPEAATILGTERGLPANAKMLDSISSTLTADEKKAVEYTASLTPLLGEAPSIVPNGASAMDSIIARYEQEVLFGNQSAADAAKAMIAEVAQSIKDAQ
jgi:multiple sugar transport system substrate-binding protein